MRHALSGRLRLALGAGALALTIGCGSTEPTESPQAVPPPPKDAVVKVTQNGPVKATVTLWPPKPVLSEPLYVRLTVEAEAGVAVDLPFQTGQLGEAALGRFRVVDFERSGHAGEGGRQVEEHTYTLQALASGRHRVPPFRLEMQDRRGAASGVGSGSGAGSGAGSASGAGTGAAEILTEEVPLEISPIPVDKVTASLQPAYGPLLTSVGQRPWWHWLALAAVAVAWLALGLALWRRWKTRQAVARQRSAYEEAVAELRVLEESGAPDEQSADAWFVRLSAIVRRYLESRYDIRAPELTTEEFLQEALRASELSGQHRRLLQMFLERCDRVKFAGYRPDSKESLETLQAARTFIEDPRLREQIVAEDKTAPALGYQLALARARTPAPSKEAPKVSEPVPGATSPAAAEAAPAAASAADESPAASSASASASAPAAAAASPTPTSEGSDAA